MNKLYHGDCLDVMPTLESESVDMVMTDPPYGTTACKWDSTIPLEPMWNQLKRLCKPNAAIVMTSSQPFTTKLIGSNLEMFRCEWIWDKTRGHNFAQCNFLPMKSHENVVVFGRKRPAYYPQKVEGKPYVRDRSSDKSRTRGSKVSLDNPLAAITVNNGTRYPLSIQVFKNEHSTKKTHPTQKPVALMEYFIKTHTNEGDTVLDFAMGSGTTGVACKNLGRNFIGIEKDAEYFQIAKDRIKSP